MYISLSILVLGVIGIIAAVLLFFVAKKFMVYEDPKIGEIEELLPGANCGGCGFSGCHAFAIECVNAKSLENLNCSGVGEEGMKKIGEIVGLATFLQERKVAIVKCLADCQTRKQVNAYDGIPSCRVEASLYQGESDCVYGCLGNGDCVRACPFNAISIQGEKKLAVVDHHKCTGCGKCVEACPRNLCELIVFHSDRKPVWVGCSNKDKGPVAVKECGISCIGCSKCLKVCPTASPKIENFLSIINQDTCISCGACIEACPRHCITGEVQTKEIESKELVLTNENI